MMGLKKRQEEDRRALVLSAEASMNMARTALDDLHPVHASDVVIAWLETVDLPDVHIKQIYRAACDRNWGTVNAG